MKLYRIPFENRNGDACQLWCGSQAEAKAETKRLETEYERWRVGDPETVEVPTDKPGLIAWLNENCHEDNG